MSSSPLYNALRSPRHGQTDDYDTYSRASQDSDDSLRALELSEGPLLAETPMTSRGRSYSVSGFDFQNDLLPLTASLSESESVPLESKEKHIGLVNGVWYFEEVRIGVHSVRVRNCTLCGPPGMSAQTISVLDQPNTCVQIGSGILYVRIKCPRMCVYISRDAALRQE